METCQKSTALRAKHETIYLCAKPRANISPCFSICISAKLSSGDVHMRFRKREPLFSILLDTGLEMLDSLRERLPDNVGDMKGRVRDAYDTASHRLGRATNALRGEEDSQILGKAVALAIGVGIGVGIGLLIAPASGEKTRADIADKVTDFSDKVRENVGKKSQSATGTHGE